MRVSTSELHQLGVKAILEQQAQLIRTQQQVASGKRITSPSDDPAASAQLLNLNQALQISAQHQENAAMARSRLGKEEATLEGMVNTLQRVREIAVQANSSALTNADRRALALEVSQRLEDLLSQSNTRDANGEYLFAGYQTQSRPFAVDAAGNYTYSGDEGQRFLQIGPTRQVATGDSGVEVFRAIRNGNGGFSTLDNAANTGSGIIDPGSVTDPTAYDGDTYTVTFPIATAAGGTLTFGDTIGTDDNLTYTLSINGTAVYTVAESGTPVNTLTGLAAEINNDSATTGVRAIVTGGALYLANTTPSANPIIVTEALAGASDGDLDTATGYFGSALTGTTTPSTTLTYGAADGSTYVVEDSSGNIEASGSYAAGAQIAFYGILTNITGAPRTCDSFTISPSVNQDMFTTVRNVVTALEAGVGGANSAASFGNAINRFLTDVDQAMENVNSIRARVGSRVNAIDSQEGLNEAYALQITEARSALEDLDYAEAITRLNQRLVGLEAAQKSFLQLQGLSLFNFL